MENSRLLPSAFSIFSGRGSLVQQLTKLTKTPRSLWDVTIASLSQGQQFVVQIYHHKGDHFVSYPNKSLKWFVPCPTFYPPFQGKRSLKKVHVLQKRSWMCLIHNAGDFTVIDIQSPQNDLEHVTRVLTVAVAGRDRSNGSRLSLGESRGKQREREPAGDDRLHGSETNNFS